MDILGEQRDGEEMNRVCPPWEDQLSLHSRPSKQTNTSSVSGRHNDLRLARLCPLGHLQSAQTALLWRGQAVSGSWRSPSHFKSTSLPSRVVVEGRICLPSPCDSCSHPCPTTGGGTANIAPLKLDKLQLCVWCLGMAAAPGRPLESREWLPGSGLTGTQHQFQHAKLGS